MKLTYLGHSAFEIETNSKKLLIDPFLIKMHGYNPQNINDIFVTHAHSDHLGSAIEISKETGAEITGMFELANYCSAKGARAKGINLGAWIEYSWGKVIAVPAFHSSTFNDGTYGGCPCGYVFNIEDKIIYHSGDTCLNSEMKIIGELYNPDVVMLPVGGVYTMDVEHAILASKWLEASVVIPMHYNTFEAIQIDINEFEKEIRNIGKIPLVMKIGQSIDG